MKRFIVSTFLLLFIGNLLLAQKAFLESSSKSFLIGDQVTITMQLNDAPKGVLWPKLIDSASTFKIEVVDLGGIDTVRDEVSQGVSYVQKIKITTFDTGNIVVSPVAFYSLDSTLVAISDSLRLSVSTVPVDTTKAFMDIFDPLDEHLRFSEILPWILLGMGVFLVVGLGLWIYFRKKGNKPLFNLMKAKEISPDEYAQYALRQLSDKRLWQQGRVKDYYSEMTDIIRLYISQRFKMDAMEMLSSEIIDLLSSENIEKKEVSALDDLLKTADLVKFAKVLPLPNENDRFLNVAIQFVAATKFTALPNATEISKPKSDND